MPSKATNLTDEAMKGYHAPDGSACPHYDSSPSGMAWLVGQWLKTTGRPEPRDVRMSRGYTVRANDMLISVASPTAIERIN